MLFERTVDWTQNKRPTWDSFIHSCWPKLRYLDREKPISGVLDQAVAKCALFLILFSEPHQCSSEYMVTGNADLCNWAEVERALNPVPNHWKQFRPVENNYLIRTFLNSRQDFGKGNSINTLIILTLGMNCYLVKIDFSSKNYILGSRRILSFLLETLLLHSMYHGQDNFMKISTLRELLQFDFLQFLFYSICHNF